MSKVKIGDAEIEVSMHAADVQTIRGRTPVKTGALRDGFQLTIEGAIINEIKYVLDVEFGTSTQPGRFMIEQSLPEIIERAEKKAIEQIQTQKLLKDFTINIKI